MRTLLVVAVCFLALSTARADQAVASAQQALKDKGFYYGEVTGTKDADTTAAIRRYQIRNGLQITGDLNAETRKSLGVAGSSSTAPGPAPQPSAPRSTPRPQLQPQPDVSDLRDDEEPMEDEDDFAREEGIDREPSPREYEPELREFGAARAGLFEGTPYEIAPPQVQQRVVLGAQSILARRGYYRSDIDGIYGPGTAYAVRAYQSRMGLEPSGRFDMETLASLGLLPGQQHRGMRPGPGRVWRSGPGMMPPRERIYIPR